MAKKYPKLSGILKTLLFKKDMKAAELARAVKMPVPTIHRIVTGKCTRPYQSSIEALAEYFAISKEQLLGEKPLPDEIDNDFITPISNRTNISENYIKEIPLIPWNKITTFNKLENSFEKIPCLGTISDEGFSTTMPDSSMSPIFSKGNILIFDPIKTPADRSFVLIKLAENNILVFRQMLVDGDYKYLKPLNPDLNVFKMRLLNESDQIIAVLVESRQIYDDSILGGQNV